MPAPPTSPIPPSPSDPPPPAPRRSRRRRPSHSPVVTALSPDDITRKVIRRLEGLGAHIDMVDLYITHPDNNNNDSTVPSSSNASDGEREVERVLRHDDTTTNGSVNGHVILPLDTKKVDWEIPRKLLHSSIGFVTLYLYISETDVSKIVLVLWSALCVIAPADFLRFRWPVFERLYERGLGFLMRESEKTSVNGVIWYILGVNFALQFYPRDIATVAILILSWADTAASTLGRLYGPSSPRLPSHLPLLRIPLAPRKSLAGFIAASVTGTLIAVGFWAYVAPLRMGGREVSWAWDEGVRIALGSSASASSGFGKGWVGLGVLGVVAGLVSGVAEAMDLGSLDDNFTLPIVSGGCILGFLKVLGWIGSRFSS